MKAYRVASVSTTTNSFGLRGMILVAKDGESWEVGANHLSVKQVGELVHADMGTLTGPAGFSLGFEIPRRLPIAPPAILKKVWG